MVLLKGEELHWEHWNASIATKASGENIQNLPDLKKNWGYRVWGHELSIGEGVFEPRNYLKWKNMGLR